MSRVLVTGSTDGIGRETARQLVAAGHEVVGHARNAARADDLRAAVAVADVLVGDLESLEQTRALAEAATRSGRFDAVVHNAGVGGGAAERATTGDGLERVFAVNTVAPYLLTALVPAPARLVYLTSGLESQGRLVLDDLQYERRPWNGMQAYSDSKLHDLLLAFAVARRWPGVLSTAVDPGWIKTRMGGPGAQDEVEDGAATQVWLAVSDEPEARVSGVYLKRFAQLPANPQAGDQALQDALLARLADLTGVELPASRD